MDDLFKCYFDKIPKEVCKDCKICQTFPQTPWDKLPEGCKLEGWFFMIKEDIKQKVRKLKEELILLEVESKALIREGFKENSKQIDKLKSEIEIYSQFGSQDW